MSRELRKVPKDWEHPAGHCRGYQGRGYRPLYDEDYETALREWREGKAAWERGERPEYAADSTDTWEEWEGNEPDLSRYRPAWTEAERTHFQIYETVSEGTPMSPVLSSLQEVELWLIKQGYSFDAARGFVEDRWCPSMVMVGDQIYRDIESCALPSDLEGVMPELFCMPIPCPACGRLEFLEDSTGVYFCDNCEFVWDYFAGDPEWQKGTSEETRMKAAAVLWKAKLEKK